MTNASERGRAAFAVTLSLVFMASGAASLVLERLWFQQAGLVLGNDVWASSIVLSAFMAGMGLGNFAGARVGDRVRNPLRAYAVLELLIAAFGVGLVHGLPGLGNAIAPWVGGLMDQPALLHGVRALLAFALLLVPSTAMGMTLPLMVRALATRDPSFGRALGLLYGVNTLGAVLGVVATEGVLLAARGMHGTAYVAGGLSVLAALLAWLLGGTLPSTGSAVPEPVETAAQTERPTRWLIASAASGFLLLALEVVWLRVLVLFLNDTPLAFAVVLALVLLGIAIGSLAASVWSGLSARAADHASLVALAAGALGVCGVIAYPTALGAFFTFDQGAESVAGIAAPLLLPTSLCSGALFALLGSGLRRAVPHDAGATGRLTLANTFGAALGAPVAGMWLLPALGMEKSLLVLFAGYGVLGFYLAASRALGLTVRVAAFGAFALAFVFFPYGEVRSVWVTGSVGRWMTKDDKLIAVREGQLATLAHVKHGLHGLPVFDQLATNAYSMSVNDFAARRYMDLYAILPGAVHPRLKRALVIGYGIGNTVRALTALPDLQRIDVVDISPDILALARGITPPGTAKHPLADARVHVRIDDGRFFLEATPNRYDLITGEPPPPVMAGVASLYSREYFARVYDRLADGGMATYWLPMMNISAQTGRSIIAAFCHSFSDCSLWHGSARNFMLFGTKNAGAHGAVTDEQFTAQWRDPESSPELHSIGLEMPGQLGAMFIGDNRYLNKLTKDDPPLSDEWPRRMQRAGTRAQREDMMWAWRDTQMAKQRFINSKQIKALWPPQMRKEALRHFENQRLINDLLFPGQTAARQVPVLHQLLDRTPLRFPVLLMLNSDPDIQDALVQNPERAKRPEWALHRAAGQLANRNSKGAQESLRDVPDAQLPIPGLRNYVAQTAN